MGLTSMTYNQPPSDSIQDGIDIIGFVDSYVGSFVQWDLLSYFFRNPHTADTASQISGNLKRNLQVVRNELAVLARHSIIHKFDFEDLVIYTLTEDRELRQELRAFMAASSNRENYLRIAVHIMQRLR